VKREVVQSPDLPTPLGPYSPVVRADNLLFVSAQAGVDPATGKVPDGGISAECRQAVANLARALTAAGSDISKVMRITLFYTNLEDLPAINAVFAETFPTDPPARSAAIVGLAGGRSVSIDAIAVL
jgi:2-iminobutanoate/2-iminopropanoate deaminase